MFKINQTTRKQRYKNHHKFIKQKQSARIKQTLFYTQAFIIIPLQPRNK